MKTLRSVLLALALCTPVIPARAVEPAPVTTDATVSLLEPVEGQCEWVRVEPETSARQVLARLAADCQGGSTALSRDGKRGAVRFWRGAVSMPVVGKPTFPEPFPSQAFRDRLFQVEFATGAVEELPLPPAGELIEYGYDEGGRLLGLSIQALRPDQERARMVEIDGVEVPFTLSGRGRPLVAHTFTFLGGKWLRLETKGSSEAAGTGVLKHRKELGERSNRALDPRYDALEIEDDAVLDSLYELSPEQPEGEWTEFRSGGHTLAIWGTPFGSNMLATGLVRRLEKGKLVALPSYPFQPNDAISLRTRGQFLLVSLADSGAHPRMYRGKKLVWSSETARAVTLWPK
ncbi:MAG TPA: hypothetical protein VF815_09260 [Myxococcaceae bacterium]